MADDPKSQVHTRDEVWSTIHKQSGTIADIKAGQAATDARLGALETAVESGFRSLASEIHGLAEMSRPKQTNYIALFVGFVTVLGLFGSFAILIANPIKVDAQRIETEASAHIEVLLSHAEGLARVKAQTEILLKDREELQDFLLKASFTHGQREELGKRVEDIDSMGSRRWNNGLKRPDHRDE